MSFASDVKNELARVEPEKKCCTLAEIAGFEGYRQHWAGGRRQV